MSGDDKFSDEFLNAFVDDQLGADEKSRVYAQLNQDENTKRAVCELRTMHELVQFAYKDLPSAPRHSLGVGRENRLNMAVAASVTLVLGLVIGWVLHQPSARDLAPVAQAQMSAMKAPGQLPSQAVNRPSTQLARAVSVAVPKRAAASDRTVATDNRITKVLVHFNSGRASDAGQILDDLEGMLKIYRASGQIARIELVVNSEGLDLLRVDTSKYTKRILRMQEQYDNLTFVACQNTIDRLKREKGVVAHLLPGVVVIDSGVAQLMRRQHQGWAYIQA